MSDLGERLAVLERTGHWEGTAAELDAALDLKWEREHGKTDRHAEVAGALAMYAFVALLWGLVLIGLVAAWRWAL